MSSKEDKSPDVKIPIFYSNDHRKLNLNALQFGDVIAKGCNAIVHSAKWATSCQFDEVTRKERTSSESSEDSGTESSIEVLSGNEEDNEFAANIFANKDLFESASSPEDGLPGLNLICRPYNGYDLAVKMMFNYEAESNAPAIMQAMHKEVVPSRTPTNLLDNQWEKGICQRKKYLPPHPNIVEMNCSFADVVPHLPQAMSLYPDALPRRLNQAGAGRNMTLFVVMKRYDCSLQEYLKAYEPSPRTRLLLMAQLFEAVVHLASNGIAHRDLKTDNILLSLSEGPDNPKLVITDFGCCLADEELGLHLPYYTAETSRGGNSALMAPEVACAQPGRFKIIDYTKADLWAAGTLIYEILGYPNPFHHGKRNKLDSRTYTEIDLPAVPKEDSNNVVIWKLIHNILQREPSKRLEVNVVANIIDLLLLGPIKWTSGYYVNDRMVVKWLVTFAAKTLIQHGNSSDVERLLSVTFLKRAKLKEIMTAVDFMRNSN